MRTRLSFIPMLCAFYVSALSQTSQLDYRPFAQDNKTWEAQVGFIKENFYCNKVDGDTVINGETWKKVYNYFISPYGITYYAAIRDAGKKVYAIPRGSNRPRLLYDFGLKVGDIVGCGVEGNTFACLLDTDEQPDTLLGFPFYSFLKVERIDTIKGQGLEHRRFILTLLDAFRKNYRNGESGIIDHVIWIEGVGSSAGPFLPWAPLPPLNSIMQRCKINRTYILGGSDFYQDEEPNAIQSPQSINKRDTLLYDLQGRRLSNRPEKGMYIEDGQVKVK